MTFATPGGFITGTNGCVNPGGTPGGVFSSNSAIGAFGSNCGTPPPPGGQQEWGFKMTTGSISGSDPYPGSPGPFGRVVTTAVPPGTPFAPNVATRAASLGFFFTRMGGDTVMGTHRNLVLLGGGVAIDPISGNAFYRITELRFQMQVPEPAMAPPWDEGCRKISTRLFSAAPPLAGLATTGRYSPQPPICIR